VCREQGSLLTRRPQSRCLSTARGPSPTRSPRRRYPMRVASSCERGTPHQVAPSDSLKAWDEAPSGDALRLSRRHAGCVGRSHQVLACALATRARELPVALAPRLACLPLFLSSLILLLVLLLLLLRANVGARPLGRLTCRFARRLLRACHRAV
jgi:hypothetical protein